MRKRRIQVIFGVGFLVILIVLIVPLFVNADSFRPMLERQLSDALRRKVTLGHLSFSLFSGSLVAQNVSIADDPAFGGAPFLEAKSLHIGVESGQLILHQQLRVTSFSAESPIIRLIHRQGGLWNFSSLGRTTAADAGKSNEASAIPNLTVGQVTIKNGTAMVSDLPATTQAFVYSNLNVTIQQLSFAKSFPFQLGASLPGDGTLELSGRAGPVAQKDASDTPFDATLQLKHFDPVAAGVLQASQGISMVSDVNAQLTSDGNSLSSSGKVQAKHLQLVRTGAPAPNPVDLEYKVTEDLDARTGQVRDLKLNTGPVAAHVTGTYSLEPQAVTVDLRLGAPNLPIDSVEELLPAFGVRLPSGSTLRGGTLSANLAITGSAAALDISGPIEVDNTHLTGFDLGSKIQGMKAIGGTQGGTEVQKLRADVNSSPQDTRFNNIYAAIPQIGTASGNGTVNAGGALDFHLLAKLSTSTGVGALAGNAVNAIGGVLGNLVHTAVTNGIPINITGTSAKPLIQADLGSLLQQQSGKSASQQPLDPASVVQSLFGKH